MVLSIRWEMNWAGLRYLRFFWGARWKPPSRLQKGTVAPLSARTAGEQRFSVLLYLSSGSDCIRPCIAAQPQVGGTGPWSAQFSLSSASSTPQKVGHCFPWAAAAGFVAAAALWNPHWANVAEKAPRQPAVSLVYGSEVRWSDLASENLHFYRCCRSSVAESLESWSFVAWTDYGALSEDADGWSWGSICCSAICMFPLMAACCRPGCLLTSPVGNSWVDQTYHLAVAFAVNYIDPCVSRC